MDIVKLDTVQLYKYPRSNKAVGVLVHGVACQILITVAKNTILSPYPGSNRVQWLGLGKTYKIG